MRRIRWLWQQRDKIRLGSRDSIASNVAMVMTHHRLPLLSRRHEISQGTEEPPPQQPLQSANPALPGNSLGVDVLVYPMILPSLCADVLLCPKVLLILTSLKTSLGMDVLLYPKVLVILPSPKTSLKTSLGVDVLLYPMILPSLGLDVLVYLMHRHRIELPQVTLCPRHSGR